MSDSDTVKETGATATDVKYHYQIMLGRDPESQSVTNEKVGQAIADVTAAFITSKEFGEEILGPIIANGSWKTQLFVRGPDEALITWMGRTFNLESADQARIAAASDWRLAHALIFATPTLRKAAETVGLGESLSAYVDALRNNVASTTSATSPPAFAPIPIKEGDRRVIIVDATYPTPDRDSGSVDAVTFVDMFRELGYEVYFVATANFYAESLNEIALQAKAALELSGVHVLDELHGESVAELLRLNGGFFEVSFLSRVYAGGVFFETLRTHAAASRIIFNTVDLHGMREMREALLEQNRLKVMSAYRTLEREFYLARLADATIVVSAEEVKLLEQRAPGSRVFQIPLIRTIPGTNAGLEGRSGIGFIGGYLHTPNIDAVRYFLEDIWPLVIRKLPGLSFYLMGADMPPELRNRNDPGLVIVGHVGDLGREFDRLRLTVAPLRYGAGAKGKVVSSLSHGLPCVATPIAAEGMGLTEDGGVLIADNPAHFADQIVRAYLDDRLWQRLSASGLRLMQNRYSRDNGIELFRGVLTSLEYRAGTTNGLAR